SRARTAKSYVVMQDVNRQLFSNSVKSEVILGGKKGCEKLAEDIMKQLDIDAFSDRHPASLSGGQKQRVAICSAITAEKEIMLYDEPTSGLDYVGMKNLCDLIKNNREKHLITMVITHDIELVLGCCSHILHMHEGKVNDFYELNDENLQKIKDYFILEKN
ncbi:MAG: ATP-binding cassette domain-containing protein, partial [Bacillota bacterium]